MKSNRLRPWLRVVAGGELLVSSAGGVLLVGTARVSGLGRALSRRLVPWRLPLAIHDPGKIVLDLAMAVALGGDCAADLAVVRAQQFGINLMVEELLIRWLAEASGQSWSEIVQRLARTINSALPPE